MIAEKLAPKYTFGYFEKEDIIQEAIIFGLEAYQSWDQKRPLENFLSVCMSRKLKNFKRDKYFRLGLDGSSEERQRDNESKKNLMSPITIHPNSFFIEENFDGTEEVGVVLAKLPPLVRNDFLRMANGVSVTKGRKELVIRLVKEIIDEDG